MIAFFLPENVVPSQLSEYDLIVIFLVQWRCTDWEGDAFLNTRL